MNKVIIIGRLTKDPEIRTTQTGKKVASFSLAVNEGKDSNGQEMVQFFNCSAWDRLAEIAELQSYITKLEDNVATSKLKKLNSAKTFDAPKSDSTISTYIEKTDDGSAF